MISTIGNGTPPTALVVFTRSPMAEDKRLGIGTAAQRRLVEAMIACTLDTVRETEGATVVLAVDEATDSDRVDRYACTHMVRLSQRGSGFEDRLINALTDVARMGFSRLIVVGTDTPGMSASDIRRALSSRPGSAMIGPSLDGGFYLLAIDADRIVLLHDLPWRESRLLESLKSRLGLEGIAYEMLARRRDVDGAHDARVLHPLLTRLCRHHLGVLPDGSRPVALFGPHYDDKVQRFEPSSLVPPRSPPLASPLFQRLSS